MYLGHLPLLGKTRGRDGGRLEKWKIEKVEKIWEHSILCLEFPPFS